ncbi:phage holin family protein [Niabella sp.]|uniref:phage holin family protein n=1 Tax=Niabella sp. TaxID=1962976 RepID=UPI00263096FE|nr:phage holin family protein [Niabella sp.]
MKNLIQYLPGASLLIGLLVVFILDFIFGVSRATLNGIPRTSKGLRKSVSKFLQYGGCIIVSIVILNLVVDSGAAFGQQFAWVFGDLMLYMMIYTEVVSIFENMEAMAPDAIFIKVFVRPVRQLLTLQLKRLFKEEGGGASGVKEPGAKAHESFKGEPP